jgi:hypothetical protein
MILLLQIGIFLTTHVLVYLVHLSDQFHSVHCQRGQRMNADCSPPISKPSLCLSADRVRHRSNARTATPYSRCPDRNAIASRVTHIHYPMCRSHFKKKTASPIKFPSHSRGLARRLRHLPHCRAPRQCDEDRQTRGFLLTERGFRFSMNILRSSITRACCFVTTCKGQTSRLKTPGGKGFSDPLFSALCNRTWSDN